MYSTEKLYWYNRSDHRWSRRGLWPDPEDVSRVVKASWSVLRVNFLPNRKLCQCSHAQMHARASLSLAEYFLLAGDKVLDAKAIGWFLPLISWDKTAPKAIQMHLLWQWWVQQDQNVPAQERRQFSPSERQMLMFGPQSISKGHLCAGGNIVVQPLVHSWGQTWGTVEVGCAKKGWHFLHVLRLLEI